VAQLMVRNLPDKLVRALKQQAAKRNRSAEQEHREILKAALQGREARAAGRGMPRTLHKKGRIATAYSSRYRRH
jgi:plasmid stability protein